MESQGRIEEGVSKKKLDRRMTMALFNG